MAASVLLLNFGGPETLDDVRPFLFNLFSDPDIILIKSSALRKALAWMIATARQRKSRGLYRQIGGGSPLRRITEAQAEALRGLGSRGVRKVLMVPVSFVSDHIETLQEIDIAYRDLAAECGIREFHRAASLNVYPKFIEALADIVERQEAE